MDGLSLDQLADTMQKEVSPYLKADQILRNLESSPDVFVCTDSHIWRLKAIVEKEQKQADVQKIISDNETINHEDLNIGVKQAGHHEFSELREDFITELKNDLVGPHSEDELLK